MTEHRPLPRSLAFEAAEDAGSNLSGNPTMGDIIAARFSRRGFLKGSLAVTAIGATVTPLALLAAGEARATTPGFAFTEIEAGVDQKHHVAPGYAADILIRWGDPVLADAPAFDPANQTAEAQAKQFGYNNDFLGVVPLPGQDPATRALLVVNHEYTNEELMFPGVGLAQEEDENFKAMTPELVAVEIAAHGGSVLEIEKADGKWRVVPGSSYARRITGETEMAISGPAAGSDRLKTGEDPTGTKVRGMLNNCAGGITPWGTWLSCEENINGYFWGELPADSREAANYKRMGIPAKWYNWGVYHDRFDVSKQPNEPNRFGWVVEIDPLDPTSVPKKRTAMGRFKHEGAATILNKDGRVVVYSGDDERFDYVYKFVTDGTFDPNDRAANMDLLDSGTLYVARFSEDGRGEWLPLVHGQGPLTAENGFASQADVVIEARRAGDVLGATKMDRPEDVEASAKTGKVYVMLTNNTKRTAEQVDAMNPREKNAFGHIVEITPDGGDQAATGFAWEILLKAGDPSVAAVGSTFSAATSKNGWFGMPDNCAVDGQGRLWVTTDGNNFKATGRTDGVWAVETDGAARATSKLFFRVPVGAEMCGPYFTADDETLFVAVQHPGEGGDEWPEFGRISSFADPVTRWPDFAEGMPPRPSVVVITKDGGGHIGS